MRHLLSLSLVIALLWAPPPIAAEPSPPALSGLALKPGADGEVLTTGFKALAIAALSLFAVGAALRSWRRGLPASRPGRGAAVPLVCSSHRATRRTVLLVVRWQGRDYLLAESGDGVCVVDDVMAREDRP